jgi:hypothetical protein
MIFTSHTTTRPTSTVPRPRPKPNNFLPTARTPLPVALAGSALPNWSMFLARAPSVVAAALVKSASASCSSTCGKTRKLQVPAGSRLLYVLS